MAWAAGFFDGEGGTYVGGRSILCSLPQKNPDLLYRLQAAVGAGKVARRDERTWQWYLTGLANVQHVLGRLWPYLGEIKKDQARVAVREWVLRPRERAIRGSSLTIA